MKIRSAAIALISKKLKANTLLSTKVRVKMLLIYFHFEVKTT